MVMLGNGVHGTRVGPGESSVYGRQKLLAKVGRDRLTLMRINLNNSLYTLEQLIV